MEAQYFIFDGIRSVDMDIHIVRIGESGHVQSPYWGSRSVEEHGRVSKRNTSYHYGVSKDPIVFTVQLALLDRHNNPRTWTPEERFKIAKWLVHDDYKEFQASDDLGKIYYAMCVEDSNLFLINSKGYVEITFTTNSPYAWSPLYIDTFDLSNNEERETIIIKNRSNVDNRYMPKIEIELIEGEEFTLTNLSNKGKKFKFTDLKEGEVISVDNENRMVYSSRQININPFKNFNRGWLELVYGSNRIEVEGKCKIRIKMQFPIAQ